VKRKEKKHTHLSILPLLIILTRGKLLGRKTLGKDLDKRTTKRQKTPRKNPSAEDWSVEAGISSCWYKKRRKKGDEKNKV